MDMFLLWFPRERQGRHRIDGWLEQLLWGMGHSSCASCLVPGPGMTRVGGECP